MKKKILLISSIILAIVIIGVTILIIKKSNTKINESKLESTSTSQESIIGQNDINIVSTNVEAETKDKENENTEEKELEEIKQETKEEIKQNTEDKKIENTKEKTTNKVTKETSGTAEAKVKNNTPAVPTKKEEPARQPQQAQEQEAPKPVEEPKQETKKINLSKYDYYENSLNGTYKGFIRDDAEMGKLKSLIDTCISEFGYTNVKIVQDSFLARSGLRSFTANKTNVENAVYNSDGFTICYYAVKEYHISSDGTETLFQTRSYIKVK